MSELPPVRQAPDSLDLRAVLRVGAVGLVVCVVAVIVVYVALEARGEIGTGGAGAVPRGRPGGIREGLLVAPRSARARAAPAELEGYGWVDRDAGIARIPIERAMDVVAGRGR